MNKWTYVLYIVTFWLQYKEEKKKQIRQRFGIFKELIWCQKITLKDWININLIVKNYLDVFIINFETKMIIFISSRN